MYNLKLVKKSKMLAIVLLVVMVSLCALSTFMLTSNNVSAQESLTPRVGLIGSIDNPYIDTPWSGRIDITHHIGGSDYVRINVDTRGGVGAVKDNVIIEFTSYYLNSSGKKVNNKLSLFHGDIGYYLDKEGTNQIDFDVVEKADEAVGGFTKFSNSNDLHCVKVGITVNAGYGDIKIHFMLRDA